ncbi:GNAT family N-acetyltransferase [Roseivivax sp. CAU 1761]
MSLDTAPALPVIVAERIALRPLRPSDAPLIARHAGRREVAEMTVAIPHPFPADGAEAFVAAALAPQREEEVWAIDASAAGGADLAGVVSLKAVGRGQSEIGYWVAPEAWGTGLASEAVRALVAANPLGNCTIFASVFQDNPASVRVLVTAGFQFIGDAESPCAARGTVVPTWTYLRRLRD